MIGEQEATEVLGRMLDWLFGTVPRKRGRIGSDFRRAVGDLKSRGVKIDGAALVECFTLARLAGATFARLHQMRIDLLGEKPQSLAAIAFVNAGIRLCLSQQCILVAAATFRSRTDVESVLLRMNEAFEPSEMKAADSMDAQSYGALVTLHSAMTRHLTATALPLPRVQTYHFADSMPSLTMAQRIYANALRCDDLRAENKVVHPAFMPTDGRALAR